MSRTRVCRPKKQER